MTVNVCDACGKTYSKYDKTAHGYGNSMSIFKKGRDGKLNVSLRLELCPDCMEQVWQFVKEDLMSEEGAKYEDVMGVNEEEIGEAVASADPSEEE